MLNPLFKKSCIKPLIVLVVIIFSCLLNRTVVLGQEPLKIYPPPPDTTRIQYLMSINSSKDILEKQSSFNRFLFGEKESVPIIKPYGISCYKSKLYICDTGTKGLVIIDLDKGSFEQFIPGGKGQLQLPLNCATDKNGNIYVADGIRRQVVVFNPEGEYLAAFGELTEEFKPTDIAISDNMIWVASISDHHIYAYNLDGYTLAASFTNAEAGDDDYLYQPANLCYRNGQIYISDIGDYRVKVFKEDGSLEMTIGSYGNNLGQFMRPKGIDVDNDLISYVVDAAFENVQLFNSSGQLLMFFGGPYKSAGDMWLPADVKIDYYNTEYFKKYVDPDFDLQYLIYVTNQYGPGKIGVYGFVKNKKTAN